MVLTNDVHKEKLELPRKIYVVYIVYLGILVLEVWC
jgi:hypothetical protein